MRQPMMLAWSNQKSRVAKGREGVWQMRVCRRFRWMFFFQGEDSIRDKLVTGVQTCALPIWLMCSFERESRRFLDSVKALDESVPEPHRSQDRTTEHISLHSDGFVNTADTDPSTDANRKWGRVALYRSTYTQHGVHTVQTSRIPGPASMETLIHQTREGGAAWAARGAEVRAWVLHQAGAAIAARRGDLISVMAAETGKTIAEADVE